MENTPQTTAPAAAPSMPLPPPPPKPVLYYVLKDGAQMGPYDMGKINEMIAAEELAVDVMVWTEGMAEWKPVSEIGGKPVDMKALAVSSALKTKDTALRAAKKLDSLVGSASGLSKLEGFRWGSFFSAVFKKHTDDEVYEIFNCGTPTNTPTIDNVSPSWPTPWLFTRMLVYGLVLTVLFYIGVTHFNNSNMVPGFILFVSLTIPFSVFMMFYELNVRRDVSMYNALRGLFAGGAASLLYALLIFSKLKFLEGAWWAGPIEESAKLYAALIVARYIQLRNGRILTGILLGCATGAGFAIFETAGYVYRFTLKDEIIGMAYGVETNYGVQVALMRGILAPFCHVVWTAVTVGGFYLVSNLREKESAEKLEWRGVDWKALADFRFLRIMLIPVCLHMVWNAGEIWMPWLGNSDIGEYAVYGFLGFVAWALALRLVQAGINQVRKEQEEFLAAGKMPSAESNPESAAPTPATAL